MLLKLITQKDHWQLNDFQAQINKSIIGKNNRHHSALCIFLHFLSAWSILHMHFSVLNIIASKHGWVKCKAKLSIDSVQWKNHWHQQPVKWLLILRLHMALEKKKTYIQTIFVKEQGTCLAMTAHPLKPEYV